MRWESKKNGKWHTRFLLYPKAIKTHWYWFEKVEYRYVSGYKEWRGQIDKNLEMAEKLEAMTRKEKLAEEYMQNSSGPIPATRLMIQQQEEARLKMQMQQASFDDALKEQIQKMSGISDLTIGNKNFRKKKKVL